jgi:DNA-binding NtrC family response regulator
MKLLIVDDEPEILSILTTWLVRKGHQAQTTNDATKVSALLRGGSFDVVLLDLIMPAVSGLNLVSEIKRDHPSLPLIVMSVIEDTRIAVQVAKEGIEGYLTKPIEFENLERILDRLCSTS